MNKRQLIEEIQKISPSASLEFLEGFEPDDLQEYLVRLEDARSHRMRISHWPKRNPNEKNCLLNHITRLMSCSCKCEKKKGRPVVNRRPVVFRKKL